MKYEVYAPQFQLCLTHTRRTRGASYTAVREEGSAHDSARATAPDWRDGIGTLLHLCRPAAVWSNARWMDHDEVDSGLRVQ